MKQFLKVVAVLGLLVVLGMSNYELFTGITYRWADALVVIFDGIFVNSLIVVIKGAVNED